MYTSDLLLQSCDHFCELMVEGKIIYIRIFGLQTLFVKTHRYYGDTLYRQTERQTDRLIDRSIDR